MISCFTAACAYAQNNMIVTVKLNGNQHREVLIDGTSYFASNYSNTASNNQNTVAVNNLAAGRHTLQVVQTNTNTGRRTVGTERVFHLRNGYDLDIVVNGNGTVQLTEKMFSERPQTGNGNTGVAMSASDFNMLVRDINNIQGNARRVSALNAAFTNNNNFFSTDQISRLVQLSAGDANRTLLLKASYRSVTDPANFSSLYALINSRAGRNNVAAYVTKYNRENNTTGTYATAMTNARFNQLLRTVTSQYNNDARVTAVFNAFNNTANYFSANQAKRLIQTVTGEANMIHLAKASYRSIVDKTNFSTVYNIIPSVAGRNEVAYYGNNYDPNVVYNGTVNSGTQVATNTAMSATAFTALVEDIRGRWLPGAKKAAVINAFNAGNYFTTAQASELIQLDNDEDDRLDMAKAAYKTLVDPANFVHIINLFNSSAYRNELALMAQTYTYNHATANAGTRIPINQTEFNSLVSSISSQWLPGAKKAAVLNAFNNSGNFFTAAQASQLIQLDNDEPDRLDMAKAAYKVLTDPENFSVLYNLFSNQSYRDQLSVYVNTNRY